MTTLTDTLKDFRGQTIKRQKAMRVNAIENTTTGKVRVCGAFTYHKEKGVTNYSHLSAQATFTDQYFLHKTLEEVVAAFEAKGYEVDVDLTKRNF